VAPRRGTLSADPTSGRFRGRKWLPGNHFGPRKCQWIGDCVESARDFRAVGAWYDDFDQTTDEQVVDLLHRTRALVGRCEVALC
jgi:hypothetical protein